MRTFLFKDIRFVLIFSVVLLDIIGIGIIFPIIPDLLKDVGIAQNASAAFWGGLLSSSYAFMQFVFSPTLGAISDIFGRRPVLLTASLLLALDYLVMGFAETIFILFIGRIIGGLAGGTISTAVDIVPPARPPMILPMNRIKMVSANPITK